MITACNMTVIVTSDLRTDPEDLMRQMHEATTY